MAQTPKSKDPTEAALSAIQEALNVSEAPAPTPPVEVPTRAERIARRAQAARAPTVEEPVAPVQQQQPHDDNDFRIPANDDRETIGQILQAIQHGRPSRNAYVIATLLSALWIVGAILVTIGTLPSLRAMLAQGTPGLLAIAGLGAIFTAPILLFYFLANVSWRGQELRMIAQSMAHVAVRMTEPESVAHDSMVTVGQAIRREVAALGDGVERAVARAGELETLVANEVSALERA
jgi:hypothetical protein